MAGSTPSTAGRRPCGRRVGQDLDRAEEDEQDGRQDQRDEEVLEAARREAQLHLEHRRDAGPQGRRAPVTGGGGRPRLPGRSRHPRGVAGCPRRASPAPGRAVRPVAPFAPFASGSAMSSRKRSSSVPPVVRSSARRSPRSEHQAASTATMRGSGSRPARRWRPADPSSSIVPPSAAPSPARTSAARAGSRPSTVARRKRSTGADPATSSAGVPAARTRPRSMTTTWSARRSTSASSCVVRRIVRPAARRSPMSARTVAFAAGSIPAVGSSSISSSGRPTRAIARARRCFSPPERSL